jgi:hypothetical protein
MKGIQRLVALGTVLGTLSGCAGAGLGTVGDVLGGVLGGGGASQQQGQLMAEVQGVDARGGVINVRTDNGQTASVAYDRNTVVVYRQQQYPVDALERGDLVAMQVQQVDRNRLYASRVDVQQSVQERTGAGNGSTFQQVSGRVAQIDHARGFFELQTQFGTYTVVMPGNAPAATAETFRRLRAGQNVRIEGTVQGTSRIDLYRFI